MDGVNPRDDAQSIIGLDAGKTRKPTPIEPGGRPIRSCGVCFTMADPEGIYNWHRLDGRITTSGQPTEVQLAEIRDLGVRHIVNLGLHTHEKALPDEAATVDRLGMTYIHIPVDFQNPTEQDFEQFCTVMERLKDVPVNVHCIANARVSAFFYRFRRDVLCMARPRRAPKWKQSGSRKTSGSSL